MKYLIASLFALLVQYSFTQNSVFQLWTETGFKYKFNKELDFTADWTNRVDTYGLTTSFPQVSAKYKVLSCKNVLVFLTNRV